MTIQFQIYYCKGCGFYNTIPIECSYCNGNDLIGIIVNESFIVLRLNQLTMLQDDVNFIKNNLEHKGIIAKDGVNISK